MNSSLNVRDIIRIAWLRKWFFIIPSAIIMIAAIIATNMLPRQYTSEATILVEQQNIPQNIVPTLVNDFIERRLEALTLGVLATDNLLRIADSYNLYADERELLSPAAVASRMRASFETRNITTEFNDSPTRRGGRAMLAFQVQFTYEDPTVAQRVTNEIVSAYLAGNLDARRRLAEQTTTFVSGEREAIDQRVATIEDEFARFQAENRELMPDEANFKRRVVENIERQLRSFDSDLRVLTQRQSFLTTQLALTSEFHQRDARGSNATPESRLELLRAELATARARYSREHPDLTRLEREVRSLEAVVSERSGSSTAAEQQAILTAELAALRERYTDEHPDVQRVQRELRALRTTDAAAVAVDRNPTFVQLSAQLNSVEAEIGEVEQQRTELEQELVVLQESLAQAPLIEREYNHYRRQLENALADRDALAEKEATARLSGSLEANAMGERLTLIGAPTVPGNPSSPNTKLILAIGFVLAVGSGGGAVVLAELLDRSIRHVRQLTDILGDAPLVSIPVIKSPGDLLRKRLVGAGAVASFSVLVVGGLLWLHYSFVPLDVLSYQTINQLDLWGARLLP